MANRSWFRLISAFILVIAVGVLVTVVLARQGTAVAVESAGIILVQSNPPDVVKIFELSRATHTKMISRKSEMQVTLQKSNLFTHLYQWFVNFMLSPLVVTAIFIGNSIGVVAGMIYWYAGQLRVSPWWLWPFIPDSPLNTFWVLPALALVLWRKPGWPLLNAYAAFGVIKYGLWTVVFWALYWLNGGPPHLESISMSVTHLIMALQGLLLLGFTRLTPGVALSLGAWFLFNDWLDFGPVRLRPGLPPGVSVTTMMWVTVALTVLTTLAYLWIARRGGRLGGLSTGDEVLDR